ncbi:DUF3310 domain-containing protein [Mammaliicoccus sciuri]|uniref:DUF3310 domain-containing protein n=1 Tax=Mammaliicoccus sciuri TaxID=1296 RepID=UPI002883D85F|nr:DUF3310 domain-containing protein [Mammaliicoccus sciuri]MDT0745474.1 DUF3310 domain-containing protein [Mammaliicoccus sciuri]
MEFKAGDRVHVTRFESNDVDFYAMLTDADRDIWELVNCTDFQYEGLAIYKEIENKFGIDKEDYYTLATDEEDTEEPVIQRINDTVNQPSHYNFGDIEVVDFIEQVTKHYNSDVAYHIGNAIKYISRAPHKNGKEDIAKAKWYIERAFDKWE